MDIGDLVPDDFEVPSTLETDKYRLRKLTLEDGVKDYVRNYLNKKAYY